MAQHARPDSDIQTSGWNCSAGAQFFELINEAAPDDGGYVYTDPMGANTLVVGLGGVNDPQSGDGHTIRFRAKSANAGKGPETCECALYENGTQRATTGPQALTRDAYQTFQYTLTSIEADSIGDYANLRLHFIPEPGSGTNDEIHVSWAEFEVPDAATEFVYGGSIFLAALNSYAATGGMVYGGAVPFSSIPGHSSVLDMAYAGDILLSAAPGYGSAMSKGYDGAIPLDALPAYGSALEKGYGGAVGVLALPGHSAVVDALYGGFISLLSVPSAAYSLEGATEFVYSGQVQLATLMAYISSLDKGYDGQAFLASLPNYSSAMEKGYDGASAFGVLPAHISAVAAAYGGQTIFLAVPSAAYSLSGVAEFVYSGRVDAALLSAYLSRLEKGYGGAATMGLLPAHSVSVDAAYGGQLISLLVPSGGYSLQELLDEFVYSGLLELGFALAHAANLRKFYEGRLDVVLVPEAAHRILLITLAKEREQRVASESRIGFVGAEARIDAVPPRSAQ